jgi:hypothetical protein
MDKKLRKRISTILILNLSLVDICYCVLALPFMFITYSQNGPDFWKSKPELCRFSAYVRYGLAFVDWSSLALVAVERYPTYNRFILLAELITNIMFQQCTHKVGENSSWPKPHLLTSIFSEPGHPCFGDIVVVPFYYMVSSLS